MFEKNKEKMKEKMEPDKVLRFAIVAVMPMFRRLMPRFRN